MCYINILNGRRLTHESSFGITDSLDFKGDHMKKALLCGAAAAALSLTVSPTMAADINFTTSIDQSQFKSLSKEVGVALGYRNLAPANPLGITGFDIGVEASAMKIDKSIPYWDAAFNSNAPSYLLIPKIRARKGLPFGIDVGGMFSYVPNSNIKLFGAELSKSIIDGNMVFPAVGIRGTYTKLTGVNDLALQTYGVDATISKGIAFITPYAGAGMMWIKSEAKGNLQALAVTAGKPLNKESITVPRFFGGMKISPIPLVGVTVEAEYAERPIISIRAAVSF
jgi:hypothetical protein